MADSNESRNGEPYVDAGMAMARKIFEKRGNHTEVHLNEGELAGFLAIAISNGVAAARSEIDTLGKVAAPRVHEAATRKDEEGGRQCVRITRTS